MTPTTTNVAHEVRLERLPALDGLRAIAVYLVVLFHSGLGRFAGGFIGVDVFFVLSGFLITRLLLVEHARTGRIDLLRFYGRRIRRLLPAATVALVVTCVLFVAFASPIERRAVLRDARSSAFYVANWNFIDRGQDYFGGALESSPFLHLWSLAVEEQFYVVWPLAMLWIARRATRSDRTLRAAAVAIGAAAAAGAAYALAVADANLLRSYYGTDTRAYQLLAGAAIAFALVTPDGRTRHPLPSARATGLVGIGLLGVFAAAVAGDVGPVARGSLAAVAAASVIAGVAAADRPSWPARVLGLPPLVHLGDLSYGTYLWHWPLVVVLDRTLVIGPWSTAVVVSLLATGLARLSMDLVERPIRRRSASATPRRNRAAVGAAIATALVVGVGVAPTILRSEVAQLRAAPRSGYTPTADIATATPVDDALLDVAAEMTLPASPIPSVTAPAATVDTALPSSTAPRREALRVDGVVGANPDVVGEAFDEGDGCVNDDFDDGRTCIVTQGSGPRMLLVGDSHANKLIVAFADYAVRNDLTLATVSMVACPWQRGLLYELVPPVEGARQICRDQRATLYEDFAAAYRPDVVVMMSHDLTSDRYVVVPSGDAPNADRLDDLDGLELIGAASEASIDVFGQLGANVIVIEPLPNAPFDPLVCLDASDFVEECAFEVADFPPADTLLYRDLAADRDGFATVDISDLVCPAFPRCDAVVAGVVVREDLDHLALDFTLTIADEMMARIGL